MNPSDLLALARLRFQASVWVRSTGARQRPSAAPSFSRSAGRRLLLVSMADAISQSQIYPFHFYRDVLRDRWGYEIREIGLETLLARPELAPDGADVVCFQAWIDKTPDDLRA